MHVLGWDFTSLFRRRNTYIIPLGLMAVVAAVKLFASQLQGARLRFYIDNKPVKFCFRGGKYQAWNVNRLLLIGVDSISSSHTVPDFQ